MELIDRFHIDLSLIIAQATTFLLLLLILNRFVYKPIFKTLNERREKIEDSLRKTEEINKRVEEINKYHQKKLVEARDEASAIIALAREKTDKDTEKRLKKASEEIQGLFEKARAEIKIEKEDMIQDAERRVAEFLIPAIEKVLSESVDKEIRDKIYENSLQKVTQMYNQ